jgi:lipopolysaccharide/colanic/teichoic acid biosynthesis glycosyltransferase
MKRAVYAPGPIHTTVQTPVAQKKANNTTNNAKKTIAHTNSLVLARSYSFTETDLKELEPKYKNITTINCESDSLWEDLNKIYSLTSQSSDLIILNVSDKDYKNTVKQLAKLNQDFITIESFLEDNLEKSYLPNESSRGNKMESVSNEQPDNEIKPYSTWQHAQKIAIDLFGVFWLFFFSWPVMIYAAYRIKKESPGPIFFKQKRIGLNGKEFTCIKFRTMHEHDHIDPYTQEDDKRVFTWGGVMRRTRIDELPQMLNILKGDMHLIGPRAEWNILVKEYENAIPGYHNRHLVRPGITGWAQVNYPYGRNIEDSRQKLMYDLYYIKNWSAWIELKVVWKTAMTVVNKHGV